MFSSLGLICWNGFWATPFAKSQVYKPSCNYRISPCNHFFVFMRSSVLEQTTKKAKSRQVSSQRSLHYSLHRENSMNGPDKSVKKLTMKPFCCLLFCNKVGQKKLRFFDQIWCVFEVIILLFWKLLIIGAAPLLIYETLCHKYLASVVKRHWQGI